MAYVRVYRGVEVAHGDDSTTEGFLSLPFREMPCRVVVRESLHELPGSVAWS